MSRSRRTDPHRPGAIVPAQYRYVLGYSLATTEDNWPMPSVNVNCELDRSETRNPDGTVTVSQRQHQDDGHCCVVRLLQTVPFVSTGGTGKCSICGARYVYGDVWIHEPTGYHLHVGHDCAAKYEMLADRSEWELENGRTRAAAAAQLIRAQNAEERAAFLELNPGLESALALPDSLMGPFEPQDARRIATLTDMGRRFVQWRSLSEKAVGFALKLAAELRDPRPRKERPEEKLVPAPVGRTEVRGRIIKLELREDQVFGGSTYKATIKVETPDGNWLAWGTLPRSLWDGDEPAKKGDLVSFVGTLAPGREPHFAFFKRPGKGTIVERAAPAGRPVDPRDNTDPSVDPVRAFDEVQAANQPEED